MNAELSNTEDTLRVEALVLGAGISGLVTASILLSEGYRNVLVVDSYAHVGGNHIDRSIGQFTFDVGSFIFQDDSPLLRHFPELLPLYQEIDPSWCKLNPQGAITKYPFSIRDDLIAAGPVEIARILLSVARSRLRPKPSQNARQFARYWIGDRLAWRSGLENYMERFCGISADQIDLKFAEKRMMWIAEYASVVSLARGWVSRRRSRRRSGTPQATRTNRQLVRPREGFARLYEPAVDRLIAGGVTFALGCDVQSIRRPDPGQGQGGFTIEFDGRSVEADRLISTIPLDDISDLCAFERSKTLPTVTLMSLFFSFSGARGFSESILYNFSHDGLWKRLTVYSDFYGPSSGREYFTVEVIRAEETDTVESAVQDFRQHTRGNGLFDGDLQLEGTHILAHAYPIYTAGAGAAADDAIAQLRSFGIESFGRQGAFQYQPTARVSTLEAEVAIAGVGSGVAATAPSSKVTT